MQNYSSHFILGNPRSGTSLFRIILQQHPEIVAPPECGFSQWWLEKYHDWKEVDNNSNRLSEFLTDLLGSKKIETWELSKEKIEGIILNEQPSNYSDLVACIYFSYEDSYTGIKNIVDKNNYYINHIPEY